MTSSGVLSKRHDPGARVPIVLTLLLVLTSLGWVTAPAAVAAPVYQIAAQWEAGTPGTVASGDVVTGVWRVNVNSDLPAPTNEPVDNVTVTVTAQNAVFDVLPPACLTAGVTPPSSISADGSRLTCNLGTHNEGTAVVFQAPMLADGPTGSEITATGSIADQSTDLPPIGIVNEFGMDIRWGVGTSNYVQGAGYFDMDLQWTLSKDLGSEAGPQTLVYDLTIESPQGAPIQIGPDGCAPFSSGAADGHPWSGGAHAANQTTGFPGACNIVQTSSTTFRLTLTGIDYDPVAPATLDSTGRRLPADEVALVSGSIWLRVLTDSPGGLQLTSNAPTYTSVSGQTAQDDPANNTESKAWTTPGIYSSGWGRGYTGSGGMQWDTDYKVSAGTTIGQYMDTGLQLRTARADNLPVGMCSALDTRYATFSHYAWDPPVEGAVIEYYTGSDPTLNPASASYDPNAFYCGGSDGGWSTTPPADPAQVRAFRVTMTQGQLEAYSDRAHVTPVVFQTIKPDTPPGTDVWSFFSGIMDLPGGSDWWNGTGCINDTPGLRYPCTTGFRDLVRVIVATPAIRKSVDRSQVVPGEPANYTLTYSANGAGAVPPTVDGYQIVDTLPVHMTYVPGSASPEPAISTNGSGQQVLTWTLNGVATNVDHALTYQAVLDATATPGEVQTNSVVASQGGTTTPPATAQVTVATDGYTTIGKTADEAFIPNLDGQGNGTGSWTVTVRSFDPLPQAFTDTIDILPYEGDGRGTSFSGSYTVGTVTAVAGATVYCTTTAPALLSDDPAHATNGASGNPNNNTVGWSTSCGPDATAVRVIGPRLDPGAVQQFTVPITTQGAQGGDLFVNRAQARAAHTRLVMRTSAPVTVANYYSASLKKYVRDRAGEWRDANDLADYPTFKYGDTVAYRIVITNTGQGTLTNLDISDDKQPTLGAFHVDELAPGDSASHEYSIVLDESRSGSQVNMASATADVPADSQVPPTIPSDPAGFDIANYTVQKVSNPASGTLVHSGQKVSYVVTVTQEGDAPALAAFTDDLTKVLDDADYNADVTANIGTAQVTNGHLVWSGTIPDGGKATITYSVTVKAANNTGDLALKNVVTSAGCAVVNKATVGCGTEHRVGVFDLRLNKKVIGSPKVAVGDQVRYRLSVRNLGPDASSAPITVTDRLPRGLKAVEASGRGWECSVAPNKRAVTCVRGEALPAGGKAPAIVVWAKVTKAALGRRLVNRASVDAAGDRDKKNNRDRAAVRVGKVPGLPSTGYRPISPRSPMEPRELLLPWW